MKKEFANTLIKRFIKFIDNLNLKKNVIIFSIIGLILYGNTFMNQLFWDDKENAKEYIGKASDLDPQNMEILEILWGIK